MPVTVVFLSLSPRPRRLTHRQLLRQMWWLDYEMDTHTLRVNVSNLRCNIEKDPSRPRYVVTEARVGYRLTAE